MTTILTDFFEVWYTKGDFITQNVLKTEITTFNSCQVELQLISLVDAMMSSSNLDCLVNRLMTTRVAYRSVCKYERTSITY